jgi:EAL domain-containing protein (putative c-di-GMP-specific phosphodiesterase class I)
MARHDFTSCVEACLTAHRVPAHCLELEVTQSMLIDTDSEEHRQMQLLRALGVAISIDDFGTGFSSLSYLHRLQIDAIKLDQSFVRTIETDEATQRLMRAVIGVARGLGLDVIAEGVETEAQRAELIKAGCPVMQGYLFAHPGPPEAMQTLLCPSPAAHTGHTEGTEGDIGRLYRALSAATEKTVHEVATSPAGLSTLPESVAES